MNAEGVLESEVEEIVRGLQQSRRYRSLSEPALVRVARWSLRSGGGRQSALKAAKRKLHQVYGAYLAPSAIASAERVAGRLAEGGLSEEEQRSQCLEVLRQHASTAERLPFLERFYADLLEGLPLVRSVVDLACGLNPFAIPWMGLPAGTTYLAVDIDERLAAALNRLDASLPTAGSAREGVSLTALAHDLAGGPPRATGDLVLLLKAVPCLEQQEPGAGGRLLRSLDAPCVVISFPARSLAGRKKGMRQTYDRVLTKMVEGTGRKIERLEYPTETVYRLLRRG